MTNTSFAIDWEEQWKMHAPNFIDGCLHLHGLKLKPGPGFGDLSHPTTNLVLQLMENRLEGKDILDIGCGSGILSLVATTSKAKSVWGVDIDPGAIKHSRENAAFNQLEAHFGTAEEFLATKPCAPITILFNMIESEQKQAWASLTPMHHLVSEAFVSGILEKDKERYCALANSWGWALREERHLGEWVAFSFDC